MVNLVINEVVVVVVKGGEKEVKLVVDVVYEVF